MSRTVAFAYAGARIQARYGRLVVPSTWERLHRLDTVNAFLQAARDTGLRPWVLQIDPGADAHQIEAQLRVLFRRIAREVAEWAPPAWRPAIAWAALLPDLPAIAHRLRGDAPLPWMAADPLLAWLAVAEGPRAPPELQGLQPGKGKPPEPLAHWLARWRERWPGMPAGERAALEELIRIVRGALGAAAVDSHAALAALQRPLRRLFRRHTRAPAGLVAYLVLTWLEMTAVRGALLRRRLGLPIEGVAA